MSTLTNHLVSWWNAVEAPTGFIPDQHGSNPLTLIHWQVSNGSLVVPATCVNPNSGAKDQTIGAESPFNPANDSFTIAVRVKLNSIDEGHGVFTKIVSDDGGWALEFSYEEGEFIFGVQTGGDNARAQAIPLVAANTWYTIIAWFDKSLGVVALQVNNMDIAYSSAFTFNVKSEVGYLSLGGYTSCAFEPRPLNGFISQAAYWNRVLTAAEREEWWNNGSVLLYASLIEPLVECRENRCCPPDTLEFSSVPNAICDTPADVTFNPPSGTSVQFPVYVILASNVTGAVIRYTTDNTEPDVSSTVYTEPFQVETPATTVKAKAFVEGCPDSETFMASYVLQTRIAKFSYLCDTVDKCGEWGEFAPNGSPDYHFELQTLFDDPTHVKRIEIYQTDAAGVWNTGQAWATSQTIDPPEGPEDFVVFPLVIFHAAQVNAAYALDFSTTFGDFAAGAQTYEMYGQPAFALSGYFKLVITYGDDTQSTALIKAVCEPPPPPPCDNPSPPTLTPGCTTMDIVYSGEVGRPFRILRIDPNAPGGGGYITIESGVIENDSDNAQDTGLTPGTLYCYIFEVNDEDCGWISSIQSCAVTGCLPEVQVSASPSVVCPGDSYNVCWGSVCLAGNLSTSWGPDKPGNSTGCESFTVPLLTPPGTICYSVEGSNACGTDSAEACVTVESVPEDCNSVGTGAVKISGYSDGFFFPYTEVCALIGRGDPPSPGFPIWGGGFGRDGCQWGGDYEYDPFHTPVGILTYFCQGAVLTQAIIEIVPFTQWNLRITALVDAETHSSIVVWVGHKLCGSTPIGTYIKTGGCATGPPTIAIE